MKKKINDVLNELDFSKNEGATFLRCMKYVKDEQRDPSIDAEAMIAQLIKKEVEKEVLNEVP